MGKYIKNLEESTESVLNENEGIAPELAELLGIKPEEAEHIIGGLAFSDYLDLANAVDTGDREMATDILDYADPVEEDAMDERGKMCPVCSGGRREGYGNDCPNCGGEGYIEEVAPVIGIAARAAGAAAGNAIANKVMGEQDLDESFFSDLDLEIDELKAKHPDVTPVQIVGHIRKVLGPKAAKYVSDKFEREGDNQDWLGEGMFDGIKKKLYTEMARDAAAMFRELGRHQTVIQMMYLSKGKGKELRDGLAKYLELEPKGEFAPEVSWLIHDYDKEDQKMRDQETKTFGKPLDEDADDEDCDLKLLDKPTLSLKEIAKKHDVSLAELGSQLAIGIQVELEHSNDRKIAKEIALDHLMELPDYYDRLDKMEDEGEADIEEGSTYKEYSDKHVALFNQILQDLGKKSVDYKSVEKLLKQKGWKHNNAVKASVDFMDWHQSQEIEEEGVGVGGGAAAVGGEAAGVGTGKQPSKTGFDGVGKGIYEAKAGPFNSPMIGKRVKIVSQEDSFGNNHFGEEGVITRASREHTFSSMRPFIIEYGVELDSGEKITIRRESVRKIKPVEEGRRLKPNDPWMPDARIPDRFYDKNSKLRKDKKFKDWVEQQKKAVEEADNPYVTPPSEAGTIAGDDEGMLGRKGIEDLATGDDIEVIDIDGDPTAVTVKTANAPGDTIIVQTDQGEEHIVKKQAVSGTPKMEALKDMLESSMSEATFDVVLTTPDDDMQSTVAENVSMREALKAVKGQLQMFHDIAIQGDNDPDSVYISKTSYRPKVNGVPMRLPEWMIKDEMTGTISYLVVKPAGALEEKGMKMVRKDCKHCGEKNSVGQHDNIESKSYDKAWFCNICGKESLSEKGKWTRIKNKGKLGDKMKRADRVEKKKKLDHVNEVAPPGQEDWIKDRKAEFKKRYGKDWESVLYATAWKRHNNESIEEADGEMKGLFIPVSAKSKTTRTYLPRSIRAILKSHGVKITGKTRVSTASDSILSDGVVVRISGLEFPHQGRDLKLAKAIYDELRYVGYNVEDYPTFVQGGVNVFVSNENPDGRTAMRIEEGDEVKIPKRMGYAPKAGSWKRRMHKAQPPENHEKTKKRHKKLREEDPEGADDRGAFKQKLKDPTQYYIRREYHIGKRQYRDFPAEIVDVGDREDSWNGKSFKVRFTDNEGNKNVDWYSEKGALSTRFYDERLIKAGEKAKYIGGDSRNEWPPAGTPMEEARNASNTEHSGAKKGKGGYYGRKKDAKSDSNKKRRANDKKAVTEAAKLGCLECDEVSTEKAWEKNGGSCPKCNNSTRGVAESFKNTIFDKVGDQVGTPLGNGVVVDIQPMDDRGRQIVKVKMDKYVDHDGDTFKFDAGDLMPPKGDETLSRIRQLAGIKETASGGATGAGAIAAGPVAVGDMQQRPGTGIYDKPAPKKKKKKTKEQKVDGIGRSRKE